MSMCGNNVYSGCIIYTGKSFDDPDICQFSDFNDVLETLIETVQNFDAQCQVKVSSIDECCGYLQGKLTSLDNTIIFVKNITVDSDGNSCETLDLSTAPDTNVMYNNWVDSPRTTTGVHQTYSLPINALPINGNELLIKARINSNITGTGFFFSVTTLEIGSISIPMYIFSSNYGVSVEVQLVRIDDTHVRYEYKISYLDNLGNCMLPGIAIPISSSTLVPSLLGSAMTIQVNTTTILGGQTITCNFLSVKRFK